MKFGEFTFIEDEGEVFVRTTYFTSLEGIFDFFETIDGPLDLIDVGITEARRIDLIPDEQALCDDLSKIYIEWISIPNSAVRSIRTPIGRLESILNQCKEFKESELPPLTIQYSLNWDGKPGEVITENYYLVARHPKYGTILEDDECFLVIQDYVIDKIQSTIENLVDTWNKFEQGQSAEPQAQAAPEPELDPIEVETQGQKVMFLKELGILDFLMDTREGLRPGGTINSHGLATLLEGITGAKRRTLSGILNALYVNEGHENNPAKSEKNVTFVKSTIAKLNRAYPLKNQIMDSETNP